MRACKQSKADQLRYLTLTRKTKMRHTDSSTQFDEVGLIAAID